VSFIGRLVITGTAAVFSCHVWAQEPQADCFVQPTYPGITQTDRNRWFVGHTFGISNVIPSLIYAGIETVRDRPREWEQGTEGYGQRVASRFGRIMIRNSVEYGAVTLLKQDPRYEPATERGIFGRLGHALASTYVVRTETGGHTFASGRFIGIFSSSFAATAWYPPSRSTNGYALRSAGLSVASNMGTNVLREFWPDIKKKLFGR
jgi:hypothetical protein